MLPLHWLPVKHGIIFKTLVLILQYLTTGKPNFFAPYLSLYTFAVKTRCSNPEKIFPKVPFYRSSVHKSKVHFNKCFSYDAPKLWNDLPHWKFELLLHYHVSRGDLKLISYYFSMVWDFLFIWGFTSLSTLYRSYHDR